MTSIVRVSFAAVFTLIVFTRCLACDCVDLSAAESFETADVVFVGRVLAIEPSGLQMNVTFEVQNLLKGAAGDQIVIVSHGSNCDASFSLGWTYQVFARRYNGHLIAPS